MKNNFLLYLIIINLLVLVVTFPSFGQKHSLKPYQNKVSSYNYRFAEETDSTYTLEIEVVTEHTKDLASIDFYFMKEKDSSIYLFSWRVFYSQEDANIHVITTTVNKVNFSYNLVYCEDFFYTNTLEMKASYLNIPQNLIQEIKLVGVNLKDNTAQKSSLQFFDKRLNDRSDILYKDFSQIYK
ncbi:hypothetical protein Fleli_0077 [Bernardetia litoralis DSM 6794]|uniref:Uncharacterized protein n=1 Tax=Bernardetia litoralis (strain ATCC 23117 / DSM 6794 / NBRC 15988 / NCIMB 1366 / Fx l1 / Sio-4) TaxID=880071 RepID=I4AF52_BERLS|nr:hypothetical protein [Bernardetia litoralis]AFM02587.1 hypothetical protein Fleli_0077 [Bernardetia litoralis DSM 6794]